MNHICRITSITSRLSWPSLLAATACGLHTTAVVAAEPLKKKRRLDPMVEITRINRKVRKIEKEIKRYGKLGRQLKPVSEREVARVLLRDEEMEKRERSVSELSEQEVVRRAMLQKEWTRMQNTQLALEEKTMKRTLHMQSRALEELKWLDPAFYTRAVQPQQDLIPYMCQGTTTTPPDADYEAPDGDYMDTTPDFEYEFHLDKQFLANPKKRSKWQKKK